MYKSSLTFLCFLFIASFCLRAQAVSDAILGPDNEEATKIIKILGEKDGHVYYMAVKGKNLYIQKYELETMRLELNNQIEIPKPADADLEMEDMFLMQETIILFATGYSKMKKASVTYAFQIGDNCEVVGKGTRVFEMPVEKKRAGTVEYRLSKDRTHLLVFNEAKMEVPSRVRFSFVLLNDDVEILTSQHFDVADEKKDKVRIEHLLIDNNNDFHCATSRALYDSYSKEWKQAFELISYRSDNGFSPLKTRLNPGPDKLIASAVIMSGNDGKITVGGLYIPLKKGRKANGIGGTFLAQIDTAGAQEKVSTAEFTAAFKSNFMDEKDAQKGLDLPLTYTMREGFTFDNSQDFVLVAEDCTNKKSGDFFYYGYIVVIRMHENGEIVWEQVINKRQVYSELQPAIGFVTGPGGGIVVFSSGYTMAFEKNIYLSYVAWESSGDLVFLFNDVNENMDLKPGEPRKVYTSAHQGIPVSARINVEGGLSYFYESTLGDDGTTLRPRMSVVEDGILYFVSAQRSREKVGRALLK